MKPITCSHDEDIPARFMPDSGRAIAIGSRYRANPDTAYCFLQCDKGCDMRTGKRCWQRRAEAAMTYRVRRLQYYDSQHGLGRAFLVTLVAPDEWQFRAFTLGGPNSRLPREKWHTVTGLVWEAELGEEVP